MPIYKDFRYTEKEEHIIIRAYCGDDVDVIVPETIKGKPVLEISPFAFVPEEDKLEIANYDGKKRCSRRVRSIQLPNSIERLELAFACCFELEEIFIPARAELFEDNFQLCHALKAIHVAADNPHYLSRNGILYSKDGTCLLRCPLAHPLDTTDMFAGVNRIGPQAFEFCTSLTQLIVPDYVTTIGALAFSNCHNLSSAQLHKDVLLEGGSHFWCCKSLEEVVYYNTEEIIPHCEFYSCPKLKSIDIRSKVRTIGESAFSGTGFIHFIVPKGVTAINRHAFLHCRSLRVISLPRSVSRIHKDSFTCCGNRYYSLTETKDVSTNFGMKPATAFVVIPESKAAAFCLEHGYTILCSQKAKKTKEWNTVEESDLKDTNYLVNAFGRYLKKECDYSAEAARFTKDIIDDPYLYDKVFKQHETTAKVCGTNYDIYFCAINDCNREKFFTFYMLIDINTICTDFDKHKARAWAPKKYIIL